MVGRCGAQTDRATRTSCDAALPSFKSNSNCERCINTFSCERELSVCASSGSLLAAMSTDMCLCKGGVPRACCPLGVTGLVWVLTF